MGLQGSITNNSTVIFNQSASDGIYSGIMSGTGAVQKLGANTVTFSGENTYSGGTTVTAGTLVGTTTSLQGDITNNAALLFNQSTPGTYASVISGSGSVEKTGSNTLILSGANTYTGSTTINGGSLQLTSVSSSIANSNSLVITSGTFNIASGAGAKTVNNLSGTSSGNITLNENITINQTSDGEFQGTISGAGKSLTKTGANKLTLSGTNTYSGDTIVSAGTLEGNTLGLQGNITNNSIVNFNQSASDGIYSGIMSGTGAVQKLGANMVTFSGTNTYSGGTTVTAGTLAGTATSLQGDITNNAALLFNQSTLGTYANVISGSGSVEKIGSDTLTLSGTNTYSGGTTVTAGTLAGTATSLQGNITNNATLLFNQSTPGTYASVISGSGSVEKTGSNTLTLSGTNTYSGGTTVTAGTLAGTTTSLQGDLTNNAAILFNQSTPGTYASVISGSGSVEKTGSNTLTLSGANTYTGSTTINGGSLQLTSASSSIANSNNLVITSGTFNIASGAGAKTVNNLSGTSSGNITLNENITINQTSDGEFQGAISGAGKSLTKTGANKLTLSGTNTYSGGTSVSAGTLEGNTLGLQGNITNNSIVNFNQSASNGIYSGIMSGTGAVQKLGTNTVTFSGANTYSGGTTVTAGTLVGTATSLQGDITNNAALLFNQSTLGTYASVISGSGSVEKIGSDTLTLSETNTYSGGTTVTAGTLAGHSN